jgi:AcrR family transcriptional regulator
VSAAHRAARRQQILDAARTCFARAGFQRTSIPDIYREAGLSAGALYTYFKSREELIEALGEASPRRTRALRALATLDGAWADVIDRLAATLLTALTDPDRPNEFRVDIELWAESLANPRLRRIVRRFPDELRERLGAVVRRAQARGELLADLDAAAVARVLLATVEGLLLQRALDPDMDLEAYVAALAAMLTGLAGSTARAAAGAEPATAHRREEIDHDPTHT